jgi:uncharacterized protein (TIGR00730 family)
MQMSTDSLVGFRMKNIAVYCGSANGNNPAFTDAARALGTALAARQIGIVYGGSRFGIMGAVADAALARGGRVVGVIPEGLRNVEVAHAGLAHMHVVGTMHERKALMADLADAFAILPGGIGTMDEFFEIWTWGHLGLHAKPIGILNIAGYFDPLLTFLEQMCREGFVGRDTRARVVIETDAVTLLDRLATTRIEPGTRWTGPPVSR